MKSIKFISFFFLLFCFCRFSFCISSDRSGNLFSLDEENIVLNTTLSNGTNANWTLTEILYNNITITGTSQVQNGQIKIPMYGLRAGMYDFTISGDGTLRGGIVPPLFDYNPELTSFVLCLFHDNDIVNNCIIAWNNSFERTREPYMFRQLGMREVRTEYMMDEFNPSPGNYVYEPNREAYFRACTNNFVRISMKIVGSQSWNGGITREPTNYTYWRDCIRTFAQYYYPIGIDKYYFVGRPDQQSWWWDTSQTNSTQKYINFLNATYQELKSVNQDIKLVAPEAWAYNKDFVDTLLTTGNFDIYSADFPCDTMDAYYAHSGFTFREMLALNKWKPFVNTEEGGRVRSWSESEWRKYYTGIANQQITGEMSTSQMVQLDLGCNNGVFMLEDWSGLDEPFEERNNTNPMTVVSEMCFSNRSVSDELAGTQLLCRLPNLPPNLMAYFYKRGNDRYIGAFTTEARVSQILEINTSSSKLTVVDGFGNQYSLVPSGGKARVAAQNLAIFIHGLGPDDTVNFVPNTTNEPPQIQNPGTLSAIAGVPFRYLLDGFDPDGVLLQWGARHWSFSLVSGPSGLSIRGSGLILWTPSSAGTYSVTARITDSDGATAQTTFNINVLPSGSNLPPVFVSRPAPIAAKNLKYIYIPKAIDPNGDTVTYSVQGPSGMILVGSSITWTPTSSGIETVQVTASDGKGGSAVQTFEIWTAPSPERPQDGERPPRNATDLTVTSLSGGVTLVWNKHSNCDTIIQRSSSKTGPWTTIATTRDTWYRDVNPPSGNLYYRVIARNTWGDSEPSNVVNGRNIVPIADAGRSSRNSGTIQLNGSSSFDPDNTGTLTYKWRIVNSPHNAGGTFSNDSIANPTFTPSGTGKYILSLEVSDGIDTSAPDYVRIYSGIGSNENVCDAGTGRFVQIGSTVTFTGWRDGGTDFFWRLDDLPLGGYRQFSSQNGTSITFVPDIPGVYLIFCVPVNDWMIGYCDFTKVIVSPQVSSDTTPPSNITDLRVTGATENSITLNWTATGDDGNTGTASGYDIRYAYSAITTNSAFENATVLTGVPTPKPSGQTETYTATNLSPGTTYYFALKVRDEAWNWSGLSNSPSGKTGGSAPVAVKILLSANPSSLPADSTSTSIITARVCDSNNNTVATSTATIRFTLSGTAGGTLIGANPVIASAGQATITYRAGSTGGVATVTGTSSGLTDGTVNINVTQQVLPPQISVSSTTLYFGEVPIGETATLDFVINNTGGGTLSGTIETDSDWIYAEPANFAGNEVIVNVTVDNDILNQREGQHTGKVIINSNGGNVEVEVILTATCILVKPNPVKSGEKVVFFGSGIVPGKTGIEVYSLSGDLIWKNNNSSFSEIDEGIIWNCTDLKGKKVLPGIYIYTYKSPVEKGTGKFTVIK